MANQAQEMTEQALQGTEEEALRSEITKLKSDLQVKIS
jgi:hypothetical protein